MGLSFLRGLVAAVNPCAFVMLPTAHDDPADYHLSETSAAIDQGVADDDVELIDPGDEQLDIGARQFSGPAWEAGIED